MPYGIYISAEGALVQSTRMAAISNNIANVDTPGFKRDLAVFQARYAEETQRGNDTPGSGSINDLGGGVDVLGTFTDFSPGMRKNTYQPTDLAIDGPGFFVVRHQGQDMVTRAGNFMLTADGALVTQDGDPVMAADGTPLGINLREGPWHINQSGMLVQGGRQTPLALVTPQSLGDLVKAGDNLFSSLGPLRPIAAEQRRVYSGSLEGSTVNAVTEMTGMIETSRVFEANVNMIRNQDQILGELVSRVLHTP